MKWISRSQIIAISITVLGLALALPSARAATIAVTSTADDGTPGTLRAALASAADGDTIDATGITGTITLTTGELVVSNSVTILGPGPATLAVDGNAASRVFHVQNGVTATISGLTVTNGHNPGGPPSGGGILNELSTLTVSNCTISGNSASLGGGIYNDGNGDNVGHAVSATLTVIASTLSGNSATYGGGIYNDGDVGSATLTVIASTFNGNSVTGIDAGGGGILNEAGGGSATVQISASTFSGNYSTVYGGALYNGGGGGSVLTVSASTLSSNAATYGGGSIFNYDATLEIGDTILNAGASGPNVASVGGTVTSRGYNLSNDGAGGYLTATGDQINTDPLLGPLRDNGGPTFTHALLPGSPAIDKGKRNAIPALALNADQRGFPRPVDDPAVANASGGDGSDIGAVEVYPPVTFVVSNNNDNAAGSLRQAILEAGPNDTISFAPSVTGTIALTTGELLIDKNVTIIGPAAASVTISGSHTSGVFRVTRGGALTVSRLTIADGNAFTGGGIFNETGGTLTLSNCTVSGCISVSGGGGISNNGTATVVNCTFYGNQSNGGGGLYNYAGLLNVFNSTVASNRATTVQGGGGVYNYPVAGSLATIRSTIVASNSAPAYPDVNGTVISQGYNLIGNTSGSSGFGAATDQTGVDPLLGPLADNGGPTLTMALRVGSPAIDQGQSFGLTTDQRGEPRPFDDPGMGNATGGDGTDIGAYEVENRPWSGASDLGGGWNWLAWFGYFNTNPSPWIYHLQHGWLYPVGTSTSSIFFGDPAMKGGCWWWSSAAMYPYLYRFSDSAWLWYLKDSTSPRWFYNLKTRQWESY